jgi:hypothetical protein
MIAAAEQLRNWRQHPARMVEELFGVKPDVWQPRPLRPFRIHRGWRFRPAGGREKPVFLVG